MDYDYTSAYSDVFSVPPLDEGGIYILDDTKTVGSKRRLQGHSQAPIIYDDYTRYTHPRAILQGQRYPGPMGAGRKEGFNPAWKSSRRGRFPIDDINWDPRPPHFNPNSPAKYAHLVPPRVGANGEAIRGWPYADAYPGGPGVTNPMPIHSRATSTITERFNGDSKGSNTSSILVPLRDVLEVAKVVLFFVLVILIAIWVTISSQGFKATPVSAKSLEIVIRDAIGAHKACKQVSSKSNE